MAEQRLAVLQINCQRSYAGMCDLGVNMRRMNASVALVQEPYVNGMGRVQGLPAGMKVFQNERGMSSIVIDDLNVECMLMNELTNDMGVCVMLQGRFGRIYAVSVYMKFNEEIEPYIEYLRSVYEDLRNECLIIGMDANAVSPLWFSKGELRHRSYARGQLLEDWIVNARLNVLNQASEIFTFSGPRGQSDIDVTVTSEACERFQFEWEVLPDCGVSDHNYIMITTRMNQEMPGYVSGKRWSTLNVDWEVYVQEVADCADGYSMTDFETLNVDDKIRKVNEWVNVVNDRMMRKCVRKNSKKVRWWTPDLEECKRRVNRLRSNFQNDRRNGVNEEISRNAYRNERRVYKAAMREAKWKHWTEFVSNHGNENPWGDVYKFCRGKKRGVNEVCSLKVNGNEWTRNWNESVNVLLNEFFPGAPDEHIEDPPVDRVPAPLSWEEVNWAVYRCSLRKAPGLDGINGEMMRGLWNAIPQHLICMYEQCMNEGYFPSDWKIGNVVILLKSPDKAKENPRSYRPICLLSVLGKVLERVIVARMSELRVNVNPNQFGFTKNKSTEDAWLKAREYVDMSDRKYVYGVFVDFKGAFDNLLWSKVVDRINVMGCSEIGLWRSYFQNRRACVSGTTERIWRVVERGCLQGSICGPAVWNLLMDELLHRLNNRFYRCVAFADDLLVIVEGQSRMIVERSMKEGIDCVTEWGREVGVEVAFDKTVCMKLKGPRISRPPCVYVRMDGNYRSALKYVNEVKYLGISMGENFKFGVHIRVMKERMMKVVGMMRRVMRKSWGLRDRVVRVMYTSVFTACAMYGASVWYSAVQSQRGRMSMVSCQRVAMYACLRVCKTVSTEAMQVLMGVTPWDLLALQRAMLFKIKKGIAPVGTDPISANDIRDFTMKEKREYVKNVMNGIWQRRWDDSEKGRCTYGFISDVNYVNGSAGMFEFGLHLGYLLTGHGSMNEFLNKRGLANTSECPCGYPVESWVHVLVECVIYADLRKLDEWGVIVENGGVNVGRMLETRERISSLNEYASEVFARRSAVMAWE